MAMRKKLPRRQQEVLEHIIRFMQSRGYPPSTRDLCDLLGVSSSSTIHTHLKALVARGLIHKPPHKSRSITLPTQLSPLAQKKELVNVPLIGKVQPSTDPLALTNREDEFPLPAQLVGGKEALLVRVRDERLAAEELHKGDLVIVRPQKTARTGELVAALTDHEPEIRRYHRGEKDVTLLGKVVGVIRKFA